MGNNRFVCRPPSLQDRQKYCASSHGEYVELNVKLANSTLLTAAGDCGSDQ